MGSNRAASCTAAGNPRRKPTGTMASLSIQGGLSLATGTTARLGENQRPSDVQPHVLRGSSLMWGKRCAWWHRGRACGACRCLDVRVCLGTGVWGERLRPAYEKNVCAAQNCDKVV